MITMITWILSKIVLIRNKSTAIGKYLMLNLCTYMKILTNSNLNTNVESSNHQILN